jgi:uncharacterized protein (DUF1697 family)
MWKVGVAFIRGINMFRKRRVTKEKMLRILKGVEDENLEILDIYRADNVIFKKRNIHYAEVSSRIENALSKHFGDRVYVTSRSAKTVGAISEKIRFLSGQGKKF